MTAAPAEPTTERVARLAAELLDLAGAIAGPTAEAEALVLTGTQALTRFANSAIHQNVEAGTSTVRLRLHTDGRTATGVSTRISRDGLRELVERTVAAARVQPPDPAWAGLTAPTAPGGPGNCDPATAAAEPADRAAVVRAFIHAAGDLRTAGYCRTAGTTAAFANSAGHAVTGRSSVAAVDGVASTGESEGIGRVAAVRLADVDGAALGARAAGKARAGAGAVALAPGRYEVVLEPTAVADLLAQVSRFGFNGKATAEGRSFVTLGAGQLDPSVTLVDDAADPYALGLPFDAEGTPRHRVAMVTAGRSTAVATDRHWAARLGLASTGYAVIGNDPIGPFSGRLRLDPRAGESAPVSAPPTDPVAADRATAALVAGVERGLLVGDLWYTRVLDPRTLVVTGLTRNGLWLIEQGEVVRPVHNLRFTQSYPGALGPGAVRGIGGYALTVPYTWEGTFWTAPAVHLDSWQFTGGAAG